MRFLFAVLLAACGGRAPQPQLVDTTKRGVPVIDEEGPRRYVARTDLGLVEVAPSGAEQPVASPPIRWCQIDDKARVVWFVTSNGLIAFDLDDRHLYPIILDNLDGVTVALDYGDATPADVTLELTETPALRLASDREMRIEDPGYVASLYARSMTAPVSMRPCERASDF